MRVYLQVPYSQKDEAKAKGARWDAEKRQWYVENPESLGPYAMWMGEAAEFMKKHGRLFKQTKRY